MRLTLTPRTSRLLDIQGFDSIDVQELAPVAPWLRLAFALCALLGGVGTLLASPIFLLGLALIAAVAAASPVHPFDLIYNHGIRHFTETEPLPRRGVPSRFGCGMGAVLVLVTAWAFSAGHLVAGYVLGGVLTFGPQAARLERFRTEDQYVGGLVGVAYAEAFKARSPLLVTDPTAFVKTPFG